MVNDTWKSHAYGHAFWTGRFFGAQKSFNHFCENRAYFVLMLIISFPVLPSIWKVYIFWKEISQEFQKWCYFWVKGIELSTSQSPIFFSKNYLTSVKHIFLTSTPAFKNSSYLYCLTQELFKNVCFYYDTYYSLFDVRGFSRYAKIYIFFPVMKANFQQFT